MTLTTLSQNLQISFWTVIVALLKKAVAIREIHRQKSVKFGELAPFILLIASGLSLGFAAGIFFIQLL